MEKGEFNYKGDLGLEQAAAYLIELGECLGKGLVVLDQGEAVLEMPVYPGSRLDFGLKAGSKKGKSRLKVEIFWQNTIEEQSRGSLTISAQKATAQPALNDSPKAEGTAGKQSGKPKNTPTKRPAGKSASGLKAGPKKPAKGKAQNK